ncbi:amidohydrolase [Roseomonas sp. AR75]|uniref:amidohydrolase family protein n=1 Tax=Roseomonas sp. AR75 TaxID=2562311 RepID=UPI0010BFFBC7|nr:amidohydrolase family protein [Roseomonas sp. AR75]
MHGDEAPPAFRPPPLACDAHFHVFGPAERYPYASTEPLRYAPPVADLPDYMKLARHLGIERFVFVQPSAYGRDNACMLDAMKQVGKARCRGIVDIDEDAPDAMLAELHAIGVRGVRINYSPVKPHVPGFAATMLPRIRQLESRCVELGWHLDFLGPGWLTEELLPTLASLRCPFSVAHMGMFLAKEGPAQPGFVRLLEIVRGGAVQGYVKFTGTYRMATPPAFADALPMARAVIAAAPERIIWGSDYPHLSFADQVGSVQLFNLLADWAPDEATRRKILVDNPATLFGF